MSRNERRRKHPEAKRILIVFLVFGVIVFPLLFFTLVIFVALGLPTTLAPWADFFVLFAVMVYLMRRETGKEEDLLVSDILEHIEPDQLTKIKKLIVAKKNETYIVAPLRHLGPRKGIYFLRFKRTQETSARKVHLPSISSREWGYSVMRSGGEAIRGIPIVRFEGDCTVPDSETKQGKRKSLVRYVSGDCVGIFASRYYLARSYGIVRRIDLTREFDKDIVAEIIGELSKRAGTRTSS